MSGVSGCVRFVSGSCPVGCPVGCPVVSGLVSDILSGMSGECPMVSGPNWTLSCSRVSGLVSGSVRKGVRKGVRSVR